MTIVRHLPEQLILVHAPWVTGGFLIMCIMGCAAAALALAFSGEGAGLMTLGGANLVALVLFGGLVKRDQIMLDGPRGHITLQHRSLWRYVRREVALSRFCRVELEELSDTARVVLVLDDDSRLPLVEAFVAGNGPRRAQKAISNWVADWRDLA